VYLQFICCVGLALTPWSHKNSGATSQCKLRHKNSDFKELLASVTKYTFSSGFAISVTILIARIRNLISSANMIMGVDLALVLWTAGGYAIASNLRTIESPEEFWNSVKFSIFSIVGIVVTTVCVFAAWIWGEILPDPGEGEIHLCNEEAISGVQILPGGAAVSAIKVTLSILAVIVAVVPRSYHRRELGKVDWLKWLSLSLVMFDFIVLISMIEYISITVFKFKLEDLGLGQVIALCLEAAQIWEIFRVVLLLAWTGKSVALREQTWGTGIGRLQRKTTLLVGN
jgi:hypothetical protein